MKIFIKTKSIIDQFAKPDNNDSFAYNLSKLYHVYLVMVINITNLIAYPAAGW